MKYKKARSIRHTVPPRRFPNTSRLSLKVAVLFYLAIGLLIGVTLLGSSYLLWSGVTARHADDIKDSPVQYGIATIELKNGWYGHTRNLLRRPGVRIGLRINKRLAMWTATSDEIIDARLDIGDQVQAQYRVGKSGDVYIEDIRPLAR